MKPDPETPIVRYILITVSLIFLFILSWGFQIDIKAAKADIEAMKQFDKDMEMKLYECIYKSTHK